MEKFKIGFEEQTEKVFAFRSELTKETDRGCALMAASFLEHELQELLESKLIGSSKHLKEVFDFNGPLGSFSSRIKMSYSIGLISKEVMEDLNKIRSIRNDFGHKYSPISFESDDVKIKILSLKNHMFEKGEARPRLIFTNTVLGVLSSITVEKLRAKKFEEKEYVKQSEKVKKEAKELAKKVLDQITSSKK